MSDLDKKLREILEESFRAEYYDYPKTIAELKQVFADEEMKRYGAPISEQELSEIKIINLKDFQTMTGQEWYSKFEELANAVPSDTPMDIPREFSLGLARKAAGLE